MYTLTENYISSVENFTKSLPDSIVKGNYERWLESVKPSGRIMSEQLEKFVSYANSLPKEFKNFPQQFALSVKNGVDMAIAESSKAKTKGK